MLTTLDAAWIRDNAWPVRLRDNWARAAAHPELAAKDHGCVCELDHPSHWCRTGRCDECSIYGSSVPATVLLDSDGWDTFRTPDHRVVNVWLADRTCRWQCSCGCHRETAQEPQQLGLFEAVAA